MTADQPRDAAVAYRVEDRSMLGDPPWKPSDPALIAWEAAHGHDVRLDCNVYTPCHVAIEDLYRAAQPRLLASPQPEQEES